jgi:hypothetical protein
MNPTEARDFAMTLHGLTMQLLSDLSVPLTRNFTAEDRLGKIVYMAQEKDWLDHNIKAKSDQFNALPWLISSVVHEFQEAVKAGTNRALKTQCYALARELRAFANGIDYALNHISKYAQPLEGESK